MRDAIRVLRLMLHPLRDKFVTNDALVSIVTRRRYRNGTTDT